MRRLFFTFAVLVLGSRVLIGQDAKFAADNLKYSRDFYAKAHFVAIAESPDGFKYDRYPANGPERIQCADGTYLRQHASPWRYLPDQMRVGIPITYCELNRYVMTLAASKDWGHSGKPIDEKTARKVDSWIKLVDAAVNVMPTSFKLVDKSEAGRLQWVFEVTSENPNGAPTRLTFRKPARDKSDHVLLHEFSGSLRVEGDKIVPGGAGDLVNLGFGYMMRADEHTEVSEFVWEEMQ